ncbi:MAG: hypothetical protein EOP47_27190 [Sphingobacteriaceae bacterium]|nr:MAG: hypothetical protein EOP47_27190 [Sphingobacteriaceae bacterium]
MDPVKKERLNKIAHILAGGIILLHGVEKFEDGHKASALFFLIAGVAFLAVAIFHHRLVRYIKSADLIFSVIEGLLAIIVAVDFIHQGKNYIQYMYFFAAAAYFVRAVIAYKVPAKYHK